MATSAPTTRRSSRSGNSSYETGSSMRSASTSTSTSSTRTRSKALSSPAVLGRPWRAAAGSRPGGGVMPGAQAAVLPRQKRRLTVGRNATLGRGGEDVTASVVTCRPAHRLFSAAAPALVCVRVPSTQLVVQAEDRDGASARVRGALQPQQRRSGSSSARGKDKGGGGGWRRGLGGGVAAVLEPGVRAGSRSGTRRTAAGMCR